MASTRGEHTTDDRTEPATHTPEGGESAGDMSGRLVVLFAVACGVSVATNYYAQALLPAIAPDLRVPPAAAGSLITVAQAGFAVGIVFLVPLGDLVSRRRLVPAMLVVTAAGLAIEAAAPSFPLLLAAALLASVFSVAVQILVPLAATLAAPARRGRVVGQVMSGLLVGVLLARTVAGLVAEVAGWRSVYLAAALLVLVLAVVLALALPHAPNSSGLGYRRLLLSAAVLVRAHPQLRWRASYGLVTFAGFGVLWTTIALLLAGPPYHYSDATIGLLSLVGALGALMARGSGRLVDAGRLHPATGVFLLLTLAGWALAYTGTQHIAGLLAAMILIDLGVQGIHIANQTAIYRLDPDARSRLTTVYMSAYFLGGALGSAGSALAYQHAGWTGVATTGLGFTLAGALLWATEITSRRTLNDPHTTPTTSSQPRD